MWLVILTPNRSVTKDTFKRRGFEGPNWCIMCQQEEESTDHLRKTCKISVEV